MLNEDVLKGKWIEFRGGVRNLWGNITDEEIDQTKGSFSKLVDLIQQKHGESKDSISQKLDRLKDSLIMKLIRPITILQRAPIKEIPQRNHLGMNRISPLAETTMSLTLQTSTAVPPQ